jgi:hypothetical protein
MDFIVELFKMGNTTTINKVNFEDIQWIIKGQRPYLLINTLDKSNQTCLIQGTIAIEQEIDIINKNLKNKQLRVIIYGRNTNDERIINKYKQLIKLGFMKIFIYPGGLFEWLCLQDIYGFEAFPTTIRELDILKFKAAPKISNFNLLTNAE